jgi:hypothetical protein
VGGSTLRICGTILWQSPTYALTPWCAHAAAVSCSLTTADKTLTDVVMLLLLLLLLHLHPQAIPQARGRPARQCPPDRRSAPASPSRHAQPTRLLLRPHWQYAGNDVRSSRHSRRLRQPSGCSSCWVAANASPASSRSHAINPVSGPCCCSVATGAGDRTHWSVRGAAAGSCSSSCSAQLTNQVWQWCCHCCCGGCTRECCWW